MGKLKPWRMSYADAVSSPMVVDDETNGDRRRKKVRVAARDMMVVFGNFQLSSSMDMSFFFFLRNLFIYFIFLLLSALELGW